MCRWLAYSGTPVLLEDLLYKPKHSLIDQSLHSRLGAETTNGDGFGVGWYGEGKIPAVYKSVEPSLERSEPLRTRWTPSSWATVRSHPLIDGYAGAAKQLPSVPARQMALDAQRLDCKVSGSKARAGAGG